MTRFLCSLTVLIFVCLMGVADAQPTSTSEGRYCNRESTSGYFPFEVYGHSNPRPPTCPACRVIESYTFNFPNYICTRRGEALFSPSWAFYADNGETVWLYMDFSYISDDWLFVEDVRINFDGSGITLPAEVSRSRTVEGRHIEHVRVDLDEESFHSMISAERVNFRYLGVSSMSVIVPERALSNLQSFARFVGVRMPREVDGL